MRIALIDTVWPEPTSGDRDYSVENIFFGSTRHFVDFDIVVWNPERWLHNYISEYPRSSDMRAGLYERFLADKNRHFKEIETMQQQGKLVVILVPLAWTFSFEQIGPSYKATNITEYLPVKCKTNAQEGDTVDIRSEFDSIKQFGESVEPIIKYTSYLSEFDGIPFMFTTSNQPVASLVDNGEGHILLHPQIDTGGNNGKKRVRVFTDALVALSQSLVKIETPLKLPDWSSEYVLPHESESEEKLEQMDKEQKKLAGDIQKESARLTAIRDLKYLFAGGTGDHLESLTIKVLGDLGIDAKKGPIGRDDLILSYGEVHGVSEVKGKTKSAAEADAAQLEKWVSGYYEEHGVEPKGILIINHYRDVPLSKRTKEAFPDQMIDYCEKRGHCLITTIQLLQLALFVRDNPKQKDEAAKSLFETAGRYELFEEERSQYLTKSE